MQPFYSGQIVQTKPEAGPVKEFTVLGHVLDYVEVEGAGGEVEYFTEDQLTTKDGNED